MTHCVCTIYLHFLDHTLENYKLKYNLFGIFLSSGSALSVPLVTSGVLGVGGLTRTKKSFSIGIFKIYCLFRTFRCGVIELSVSTRQRSAAIAETAPLKYDAKNNSVQNKVYKTGRKE